MLIMQNIKLPKMYWTASGHCSNFIPLIYCAYVELIENHLNKNFKQLLNFGQLIHLLSSFL